jgi:hypothetical protein
MDDEAQQVHGKTDHQDIEIASGRTHPTTAKKKPLNSSNVILHPRLTDT